MGTIADSIRTNLFGSGRSAEQLRPALKSWEAIARSENFKNLVTGEIQRLTPLVGSWQAASKTQLESLKDGAFEALEPVLSSWETVYRGEEFETLKTNVRTGVQRVFHSLEVVSKSKEFKSLLTSALEGLQPAFRSWKAVSRSEAFKTFKKSSLSAGGAMAAGALKQAGQSLGPAMVDRVGKVLGEARSSAAG